MQRRAFLLAPWVLAAQPVAQAVRPRLAIQWVTGKIPDAFARGAVVCSRAYTCCPEPAPAAWALEHGRFPHAAGDSDASVWDFFTRSTVDSADVVVTTAFSGDEKDSWREPSVHVPLAIRWPDRLVPRTLNRLCSHADVLPTLLNAAGVAAPAGIQGRNVLLGGAAEAVYLEGGLGAPQEWRALLRGYDKVVWNPHPLKGGEEITGLYNVADDVMERKDLRAVKEYRLTLDSLWALAQRWMERLEDGRDNHGLRTRK